MAKKIDSSIHWSLSKLAQGQREYVSYNKYQDFLNSHEIIYDFESFHHGDTDFKTFSVVDGTAKLIGWADHHQDFYYIYH